MVNVSREGHHERSHDALLEHTAKSALRVDLRPESRHSEVVLGSESSNALLLETATQHGVSRSNTKRHIDTSLNLVREAAPVRGIQSTLGLQLSAGDPVLGLVTGNITDGRYRRFESRLTLPNSFEADGKFGSERLHVMTDKDTAQTALEDGGVEGLE